MKKCSVLEIDGITINGGEEEHLGLKNLNMPLVKIMRIIFLI